MKNKNFKKAVCGGGLICLLPIMGAFSSINKNIQVNTNPEETKLVDIALTKYKATNKIDVNDVDEILTNIYQTSNFTNYFKNHLKIQTFKSGWNTNQGKISKANILDQSNSFLQFFSTMQVVYLLAYESYFQLDSNQKTNFNNNLAKILDNSVQKYQIQVDATLIYNLETITLHSIIFDNKFITSTKAYTLPTFLLTDSLQNQIYTIWAFNNNNNFQEVGVNLFLNGSTAVDKSLSFYYNSLKFPMISPNHMIWVGFYINI